ncbi:MAG TPA: hypothetical protein GXX40_08510 [Firmicutes bacterium]|nr:hypothetical protein [Bacillota bacterium]
MEATCCKLDKLFIVARYLNGLPDGIPHDYLHDRFDETDGREAVRIADEVIWFAEDIMSRWPSFLGAD